MTNTENNPPIGWEAAYNTAVRKNKRKKCWTDLLFWLTVFLSLCLAIAIIGGIVHYTGKMDFDIDNIIYVVSMSITYVFFVITFLFWPFVFFFEVLKRMNKKKSFAIFLYSCLKSGNPLASAIKGYAETQSFFWRRELKKFASDLESGVPLREAALKFPKLFTQETFQIIQIEGNDPQSMRLISEGLNETKKRSEINTFALARYVYLFVVIWQFAILTWFFMAYILRAFKEIFSDFDADLPRSTEILFDLPWRTISLGLCVCLVIFFWSMLIKLNLSSARPWIFRWFFKKGDDGHLLRFLAIGDNRNESFNSMMDIYENSMRSRFRRRQAKKIHDALDTGEDWISVLSRFRIIDFRQAELLETARRTGNTFSVLNQIALAKEAAQTRSDDLNSKIIFAVSLLIFGSIVAFLALAMLSPAFNLIQLMVKII